MTDLIGSGSKARRIGTLVVGIVVGAAAITPGVGLAAKFLTQQKAGKIFVRNMSAERGGSGTIFAAATPQFSNVKIEATTNGYLVIQGSAHFDNEESSGQDEAQLVYEVDAKGPVTAASAALGEDQSPNTIEPGETAQLAYIDVVAVDKGSHTVRQLPTVVEGGSGGGPPGSGIEVNYSAETLVVTFFPARGANVAS
jgi:hypothetical protein